VYNLQPIAFIKTPFPEKFGIPRQPGLVPAATASLTLEEPFRKPGVFDGLEGTTHLWLTFIFHHQPDDWQPKVRPPRLGGNQKRGVFATRSPRRPNRLGLSVVRLESVDKQAFHLEVSGVDMLDGTPILDIKPYVPYSDIVADATHGFATQPPSKLAVQFSQEAQEALLDLKDLKELIEQVLSLDPRPRYHQDERGYGTALAGYNVRWRVMDDVILVENLHITPEA
jgi:tRNA-Thr(GGU) m(6)t(6)A37 methyltransferase TsaA